MSHNIKKIKTLGAWDGLGLKSMYCGLSTVHPCSVISNFLESTADFLHPLLGFLGPYSHTLVFYTEWQTWKDEQDLIHYKGPIKLIAVDYTFNLSNQYAEECSSLWFKAR